MAKETSFQEEVPLLPAGPTVITKPPSETSDPEAGLYSSALHNDRPTSPEPENKFTIFVGICFALNYSIGSGILGLPYEFFYAGYILSTVLMVGMGVLTYVSYMYVLEAIQRAEVVTELARRIGLTRDRLLKDPAQTKQLLSASTPAEIRALYQFRTVEYQLSELIGLFCGRAWKVAYDVLYGVSQIIGLWSYAALFGISLTRQIGIPGLSDACDMEVSYTSECRGLYSLYVCIFWVWCVVLTCLDFKEQQSVQVVAAIARICILALMVITSIGLIYSDWVYDGSAFKEAYTDTVYAPGLAAWKWSGMANMIAVASFAYGNQYCVTDVIEPLSHEDRRNGQMKLWRGSVGILMVVYVCCGVTISTYFGDKIESPCTLGWLGFMGFQNTDSAPVWAVIVSWSITLFPAVDIGSAYPLNANTLANTIEAAVLPKNVAHQSLNPIHALNVQAVWNHPKFYSVCIRVLLCTSSALLALLEWDFALILSISGGLSLLALYGGPCVLEWYSAQYMQDISGGMDDTVQRTPITQTWIEHSAWRVVICIVSVVACIAVFADAISTYA